MPRRKSTRDILSDVAPPPADERRRAWERLLKLSPGELGSEKQRRLQQARDAQILQALRESYHAGGIDTCENPRTAIQGKRELPPDGGVHE